MRGCTAREACEDLASAYDLLTADYPHDRWLAALVALARLVQADMRSLGSLGAFDLITCLDDALNYLLGPGDLEAALAGIRSHLRPAGIAVWDVNTRAMYRSCVRIRPHDRSRRRVPRLAG